MRGLGGGGDGRHLQTAGGKRAQAHLGAQGRPPSWPRSPRGEQSRPWPLSSAAPCACRSGCLFKGLPLPLSLLPHLCRSHCCGSELHGETPLQVRFLGVWSVPSTPSSSPRPPQAGDFPSPRPLPAEGAGGWARPLHNAPGLPLGRAAGTLVAARGGRAVLTADRRPPARPLLGLPPLPPSLPSPSELHLLSLGLNLIEGWSPKACRCTY